MEMVETMKNNLKTKIAASVTAGLVALGGGYYMTQESFDLVKVYEGYSETAYPDVVYGWDLPTICWGHTKGVTKGQVATRAQCEQWYKEDMAQGQAIVKKAIGDNLFNSLTQGEKDGYGMFAHNTGYFMLQRSGNPTSMYTRLIAGDKKGACEALLMYNRAKGKVLPGLTKRRKDEHKSCMRQL